VESLPVDYKWALSMNIRIFRCFFTIILLTFLSHISNKWLFIHAFRLNL
jgi:hypothetical protein